jgi:histidine triad (HIT) family protein
MAKKDSIFTKIIKGELPSHMIYEDDDNVAFLDVNPLEHGHTLVVSKKQIAQLWDMEDKDYQSLWAAAKKVANHMKKVLGCEKVGAIVEGIEIPHVHIKLIPLNTMFSELYKRAEKHQHNNHGHHEHLEMMAQKLRMTD